jgi:hypothetical protein
MGYLVSADIRALTCANAAFDLGIDPTPHSEYVLAAPGLVAQHLA